MLDLAMRRDRVNTAYCLHVYGAAALTAADAAGLGDRAALLSVGSLRELQGFEAMIRSAKIVYSKSNQTSNANLAQAAYSRKVGGAKRYDPTWKVYCAEPSSSDWRSFHLAALRKLLQPGLDGFFSDSAGTFSYTQGGGHPAIPPLWQQEYSEAQWLSRIDANIAEWEAQTGRPAAFNGLGRATLGFRPRVGMIENAFGSNKGQLPSQAAWLATMSLIQQAQALGHTPWVYLKLGSYVDQAARFRRLILPSLMLLDPSRSLLEIGGREGSSPPWVTREPWHPWYDPQIGEALNGDQQETVQALYDPSAGLYRREYQGGFVLVNPSLSPVTLAMPDYGVSVQVAGQEGVILRKKATLERLPDAS